MLRARLFFLIAAALATAACSPQEAPQPADFRATVSVAEVRAGRVESSLATTGTVRAREEAKIVVESGGKLEMGRDPVTHHRLSVGDRVEKGQRIAVVAAAEVSSTARTSARKQVLDAAETEFARAQRLSEEGVLSPLQLDEKRSALENARADWAAALVQQGKSTLESPLTGWLTKATNASDGEILGVATVVAEVMDFREVVIDVDLGSSEVMSIKAGMVARVKDHAGVKVFDGLVERIAPAIDPTSRTFRVEIGVDNPALELRPGMFVRAEIILDAHEDVLVVPTDAVVNREGRWTVFVVEAQRAALREVEIGLSQEDKVEIKKGLIAGDRIVVSGQDTLKDGARVTVRS